MPGSVFKIVTAIAGLNTGSIEPDTTFEAQPQAEDKGLLVEGFRIRDGHHPQTDDTPLDLLGATEASCNIWYALAGLATGGDDLVGQADLLGFGAPIPFDLPTAISRVTGGGGRAPGGFTDDVELASASFGQGETFVTPLQMALVASTVANDGVLMRPRLVSALTGEGPGTREISASTWRRVMAAADAQSIQAAMEAAVEGDIGRQFTAGAAVAGRADGRQVGNGGARWQGRTALVVHRVCAGREPAGRDRGAGRAGRPWRRARRTAGRVDDGALLRAVRSPVMADEPAPDTGAQETPEAPDLRPRPMIERIGLGLIALVLAAMFALVSIASFIGGEPFLGVMGAIGCLMIVWVGGLTLFRG